MIRRLLIFLPSFACLLCFQAPVFADEIRETAAAKVKYALAGIVEDPGLLRIEILAEDEIEARNEELKQEYESKLAIHHRNPSAMKKPQLQTAKVLITGKKDWEAEAALADFVERARRKGLTSAVLIYGKVWHYCRLNNDWGTVLKIVKEMATPAEVVTGVAEAPQKPVVPVPQPAVERLKPPTGYPAAVMSLTVAGREGLSVLVSRTGESGILVTTAGLASAAEQGEARTFVQGAPRPARILEVDWCYGLATLSVSGADLPEPLSVDPSVEVEQGADLLVPGGDAKSRGLLKTDGGQERALALSGAFRRDERGGAVLLPDGRLAGILSDHIVEGRSAMALLPREVAAFLAGRPLGLCLELPPNKKGSETRSRYKVTLPLSNPAGIIQGVDLDVCRAEDCPDPRGLFQNGAWKRMEKPLRSAHLALGKDGLTANGEIEFMRKPSPLEPGFSTFSVPFLCQVVRRCKDGAPVAGEPFVIKAQFLRASDIASGFAGQPVHVEFAPPPLLPRGIEPPLPDILEPVASLPMNAVIGDLCLSPAGDFLFALNLSDLRIQKVRASDLHLAGEAKLEGDPTCLALSPDGHQLCVGCRVRASDGSLTGSVQLFSADGLERKGSIALPFSPAHLLFSSPGTLLYALPEMMPRLAPKITFSGIEDTHGIVNFRSCKVLTSWGIPQEEFEGFHLLPYPDPRRRQCWACNLGGTTWCNFRLEPDHRAKHAVDCVPVGDRYGVGVVKLGTRWRVVPEVKLGEVFPEFTCDPKGTMPKIPPTCAMAAGVGWDAVFLAMPSGALKVHSASRATLLRDYQLGKALSLMCLDPGSGRLYAVQTEPTPEQKRNAHVILGPAEIRARIGSLVVYALDKAK